MLRSLKDLIGYEVVCPEGLIGRVEDFYFDNREWFIRYLVVNINNLAPGKKVLITPDMFVDRPDWDSRSFGVSISKEAAMKSPDIGSAKPITRSMEKQVHDYFSQPYYWTAAAYTSPPMPGIIGSEETPLEPEQSPDVLENETHLHSFNDLLHYAVFARDSSAGSLEDLITDDERWFVEDIVATGNGYYRGKKYLAKPEKVERVDHSGKIILLAMTGAQVKESPEYDPDDPVNINMEERRYDYRGKPRDWKEDNL